MIVASQRIALRRHLIRFFYAFRPPPFLHEACSRKAEGKDSCTMVSSLPSPEFDRLSGVPGSQESTADWARLAEQAEETKAGIGS